MYRFMKILLQEILSANVLKVAIAQCSCNQPMVHVIRCYIKLLIISSTRGNEFWLVGTADRRSNPKRVVYYISKAHRSWPFAAIHSKSSIISKFDCLGNIRDTFRKRQLDLVCFITGSFTDGVLCFLAYLLVG
jgi:hypothetical protein